MAICSRCGREMEGNETICRDCGENNSSPNSNNTKKPNILVIVTIIIAAVVFLILGIITLPAGDLKITIFTFGGVVFLISVIFILYGDNNNSNNFTLKSNGEIFDGFIKQVDDMSGSITYVHPQAPRIYPNVGSLLWISFTSIENSKYYINLSYVFNYGGLSKFTDWLFIDRLIFKTDNNRYIFDVKPNRDVIVTHVGKKQYTYYSEIGVLSLSREKDIEMLKDMATTGNLKVRFEGKKGYKDFTFNGKSRRYIVNAYEAYIKNPDYVVCKQNSN